MTERVLLTGARTAIALDAARRLHRAGHQVFVAETLPRFVAAYSNCVEKVLHVPPPRLEPDAFIERLLAIIRDERITLLVPTGEEMLWVARGRTRLAAACDVFCDRLDLLEALHDKLRFQRLAAEVGPAPHTWPLESEAQLRELRELHGPLILKRRNSRFGQHVCVPRIGEPLPEGRWIAQRLIEGRELCSYSIAHSGVIAAHTVYLPRYRLPLGPGFYFEPAAHTAIDAWVRAFVARIGFTGSIAFDFIESADGTLYPLECNPRMTSGLHLLRDGELPRALRGDAAQPGSSDQPAMWAAAMLCIALPNIRSPRAFRAWMRAFGAARDVFWDPGDPHPFVHLTSSQGHLRMLSKRHGLSLREAATFYTTWDAA